MLSDHMRQQLLELIDGRLSGEESARVQAELQNNPALAEEYQLLLELQAAGRDWQDQGVPTWSRLAGVTRSPVYGGQPWLAWTSLAVSLAVAFLLILQVQFIRTSDGFTIKFSASLQSEAIADELDVRFMALEARQSRLLDERLLAYDKRTQAVNQQLLTAALSFNRNERREDMQRLANYWTRQRAEDRQLVGGLLKSQYNDRVAIRNLYNQVPQ